MQPKYWVSFHLQCVRSSKKQRNDGNHSDILEQNEVENYAQNDQDLIPSLSSTNETLRTDLSLDHWINNIFMLFLKVVHFWTCMEVRCKKYSLQ